MKPRSAKNKGRILQVWIAKQISKITGIECGKDLDIESRQMGQSGVDVLLRGRAAELFPYSIEAKNQESWSLPAWIKQSKGNMKPNTDWLLFCKKNYHEEIVVMDASRFFELYKRLLEAESKIGLNEAR